MTSMVRIHDFFSFFFSIFCKTIWSRKFLPWIEFIFEPILLGSECSITCPLRNQQAYCKSSRGTRSFTCEKNGWTSNSKNDCECKTACSSPEEQFPHISKGNSAFSDFDPKCHFPSKIDIYDPKIIFRTFC